MFFKYFWTLSNDNTKPVILVASNFKIYSNRLFFKIEPTNEFIAKLLLIIAITGYISNVKIKHCYNTCDRKTFPMSQTWKLTYQDVFVCYIRVTFANACITYTSKDCIKTSWGVIDLSIRSLLLLQKENKENYWPVNDLCGTSNFFSQFLVKKKPVWFFEITVKVKLFFTL